MLTHNFNEKYKVFSPIIFIIGRDHACVCISPNDCAMKSSELIHTHKYCIHIVDIHRIRIWNDKISRQHCISILADEDLTAHEYIYSPDMSLKRSLILIRFQTKRPRTYVFTVGVPQNFQRWYFGDRPFIL